MELGAEPGVPSALPAPGGQSWALAVTRNRRQEERKAVEEDKEDGTDPRGESLGLSLPCLLSGPAHDPVCPLTRPARAQRFAPLGQPRLTSVRVPAPCLTWSHDLNSNKGAVPGDPLVTSLRMHSHPGGRL